MRYFQCQVCGYSNTFVALDEEKETEDEEIPARDEICFCCHFQVGYDDDDRGISPSEWRERWIADGMPWRGVGRPAPLGWNPTEQLESLCTSSVGLDDSSGGVFGVGCGVTDVTVEGSAAGGMSGLTSDFTVGGACFGGDGDEPCS